MATALDIILRARRLLNAHGVGEVLDSELANNGLEALNAMLESLSIDGVMVYATQSNTFNLTGAQTYTIGTGGTFNMLRPDRIESAFATVGGNDYTLDIIDTAQWAAIDIKNFSSLPTCIKYDAFTPLGLLSIYPQATGTITLNTYLPLQVFQTLSTVLALPRGYERMLAYNLAIEIAPETGKQASREIVMVASSSKSAIQRINLDTPVLTIDPALVFGRRVTGYNG